MKNLTIGEAVDLYNVMVSFTELANKENLNLPGNVSYALFRNVKKLDSVFTFFTDKQKELIEANAQRDKKGEIKYEDKEKGVIKLKKDNTLNKDFADYVSLESGVDLYTVKIDVEELAKTVNGSHTTLNMLWFVLENINAESNVKVLESV